MSEVYIRACVLAQRAWEYKRNYGAQPTAEQGREIGVEVDRMLASHDREVAAEASAKAYREMSDDLRGLSVGQRIIDGNSYIKLARLIDRLNGYEDRAAEIENGADQ